MDNQINFNAKIITDYIKNNNITKTEFCKRCNISLYTLAKLLNKNVKKIKISVLYRLCVVLHVKAEEILGLHSCKKK